MEPVEQRVHLYIRPDRHASASSRRTFLRHTAVLGLSAVGLALLAGCRGLPFAPAGAHRAHVGFLTGTDTTPTFVAQYDLFRSTMAQDGWVEGQNLMVELRSADGSSDRLPGLAGELARLPLDAIAVVGSTAVVEMKRATSTIPIVAALATSDLHSLGLVESLARPGTNVTGAPAEVSGTTLLGKQIELLRSILPTLTRAAVLTNPDSSSAATNYAPLASAATAAGIDLLRLDVRSTDEVDSALVQAPAVTATIAVAGRGARAAERIATSDIVYGYSCTGRTVLRRVRASFVLPSAQPRRPSAR